MKRLASLCFASGILIMVSALAIAVSAMPSNSPRAESYESTPNACLYCHLDAHANFNLDLPLKVIHSVVNGPADELPGNTPEEQTLVCSNCHIMNGETNLPTEEIQTRIEDTQARVLVLHTQLEQIYGLNEPWHNNVIRAQKSQEQIKAERINTLIAYVEADGSWGFHDPIYTEEILTEAETLMDDLLSVLDL